MLFRPEDDNLLDKVVDDGVEVEPIKFFPIIPMLLVNGCTSGIGTGWSCSVLVIIKDIINCVRAWMQDKKMPDIVPWYRGFKGTMEKINEQKFKSSGILTEKKRSQKSN